MKIKEWCIVYGMVGVVYAGGFAASWAYGDKLGGVAFPLGMLATVGALFVLTMVGLMGVGIYLNARDPTEGRAQPR